MLVKPKRAVPTLEQVSLRGWWNGIPPSWTTPSPEGRKWFLQPELSGRTSTAWAASSSTRATRPIPASCPPTRIPVYEGCAHPSDEVRRAPPWGWSSCSTSCAPKVCWATSPSSGGRGQASRWDDAGLGCLIPQRHRSGPDGLEANCPDMIGGGWTATSPTRTSTWTASCTCWPANLHAGDAVFPGALEGPEG